MAVVFDKVREEYRLDGRRVPRVTAILHECYDLSMIPMATLERKRQLGTAVHRAIEFDLQEDLDETKLDPAVVGYLAAWRKYRTEREYEHRLSEHRVGHPQYGYAGTLDLFGSVIREMKPGRFKRGPALIDLKTTFDVHPAVALQTAAYLEALATEEREAKGAHRLALQLKPDGTYDEHWCDSPRDWPVFLSFLTCHSWRALNGC